MTPQERRTQYDFIAEIFELECKVKPDFAFHIVRDAYGVIEISFFKKGNGLDARYHRHWSKDLTEIKTHEAILAAHAYTIKISRGRSYETHYVKKGDYRIENGILYFRAAGKQHVAKENYIISEN